MHDVSFFIEWLVEPVFAEHVVGCTCDTGARAECRGGISVAKVLVDGGRR
ncbi:MAG: hypothetical protein ACQEVD_07250 [Actinomycetota bacterium]